MSQGLVASAARYIAHHQRPKEAIQPMCTNGASKNVGKRLSLVVALYAGTWEGHMGSATGAYSHLHATAATTRHFGETESVRAGTGASRGDTLPAIPVRARNPSLDLEQMKTHQLTPAKCAGMQETIRHPPQGTSLEPTNPSPPTLPTT
jgi:hypothetical protein